MAWFGRSCLAALGLALCAGVAQAQTAYPLVCRGGGPQEVTITPGASVNETRFDIYYERGPVAATGGGAIGPGQCTWVDRPLNSREPEVARITLRVRVTTAVARNRGASGRILVNSARLPDEAQAEQLIRDIMDPSRYFTLTAFNTDAGFMRVTAYRTGR